jgi:hypothetical protein
VSEVSLLFFFFVDIAVCYLFKIESCFPSILDSKPFHSPFVEKGMKLCQTKVENARKALLSELSSNNSKKKKREAYSHVSGADLDMDLDWDI